MESVAALDACDRLLVDELDVSVVGGEAGFLGDDEDDLASGPQVGQVSADERLGLVIRHVLENVGEQEAVERLRDGIGTVGEIIGGIGNEPTLSGDRY